MVNEFKRKLLLTNQNEFDSVGGEEATACLLKRARQGSYWAVTPEMQLDAIDAMRDALKYAERASWRMVKERLGWD